MDSVGPDYICCSVHFPEKHMYGLETKKPNRKRWNESTHPFTVINSSFYSLILVLFKLAMCSVLKYTKDKLNKKRGPVVKVWKSWWEGRNEPITWKISK